MATLRDLRKRLKAVKNTEKITKAMKMVAASKLRRAQNAIIQARPYAMRMDEVLQHIVNTADVSAHPLLSLRVPHRVEIVVMSSNRGLCGGFNSSILRSAERWLKRNENEFDEIRVSTIGRKARDHFRRKGYTLTATYDDIWDDLTYERASEIADDLSTRFRTGELDAVYLMFNEFKSAISQNITLNQLLPIRPLEGWKDDPNVRVGELAAVSGNVAAVAGHDNAAEQLEVADSDWNPSEVLEVDQVGFDHVYEPSQVEVLDTLLPQHMGVQIWRALLESTAAEHGARMSAMDAASRNAKDLIGKLTLQANRVRQATITTELMEIVSGAESLKG
ncbi:MAG: ATP synthase F1 subunit gamma [Deltaproteobacteria bacterium]|jgi:F-type H+-transporting ATPase subunit gamma